MPTSTARGTCSRRRKLRLTISCARTLVFRTRFARCSRARLRDRRAKRRKTLKLATKARLSEVRRKRTTRQPRSREARRRKSHLEAPSQRIPSNPDGDLVERCGRIAPETCDIELAARSASCLALVYKTTSWCRRPDAPPAFACLLHPVLGADVAAASTVVATVRVQPLATLSVRERGSIRTLLQPRHGAGR